MKGRETMGLLVLVMGSFLFSTASTAKVLISKVQTAGVSTTDEFVELYNFSSSSQSLTGWSLKKQTAGGTQSSLVASLNATLNPFSYFLIGHRDYQPINGVTADLSYSNSSNSLANNNSLLLADDTNAVVDRVDWGSVSTTFGLPAANPGAGQSLTRLPNDETGNDADTDDSSLDFTLLPSSPFNSLSPARPALLALPSTSTTSTDPTTSTPPIDTTPTSTPSSTPSSTPPDTTSSTPSLLNWLALKLNEFMPNPSTNGSEWVELYNSATTSIDVTGATLCDNRTSGSCTIASPTGIIAAQSWAVYFLNSSHLNNDGDSVLLKNPDGTVIDSVTYGSNALSPKEGESVARKNDGADTDSDADWAVTTAPTPDAANTIVTPVIATPSGTGSSGGNTNSSHNSTATAPSALLYNTSTQGVILNELFPDPTSGSDETDEFIEIRNNSSSTVDITGWKISDLKNDFVLAGTINPGSILVFTRPVTGISLNNSTAETVRLINASGAIVDEISYATAKPNQSYARDNNNEWHWTTEVTKGSTNAISEEDDVQVLWNITSPRGGIVNTPIAFNASLSADPRGGLLSFAWNFGDGVTASGATASHSYMSTGTYTVVVHATSTQGTGGEKTFPIIIGDEPGSTTHDVLINEVMTNPADDENGEFIELGNTSSTAIDLSGWQLRNSHGTLFFIPEKTSFAPHTLLVFYRTATHLTLDNRLETVALLSPYGSLIDSVQTSKSPAGESFARFGNSWQWTLSPTPGNQNALVAGEKIASTAATKSRTTKVKFSPLYTLSLADARTETKGTRAKVHGFISAPPNIFATHYFYLSDAHGGIEIYSAKNNFPKLASGDEVQVAGSVSSANDIPRLTIKNTSDIIVLKHQQPIPLAATNPEDEPLGALTAVSGEVTEITGNIVYLDDGEQETQVYLRPATKISKQLFIKGENIQVTGILETSKNGTELLPRSQNDIVDLGPSEDILKKEKLSTPSPSYPYTSATAGGATVVLLSFLIKQRASVYIAGKKAVTVALNLIKRNKA